MTNCDDLLSQFETCECSTMQFIKNECEPFAIEQNKLETIEKLFNEFVNKKVFCGLYRLALGALVLIFVLRSTKLAMNILPVNYNRMVYVHAHLVKHYGSVANLNKVISEIVDDSTNDIIKIEI